MTISISAIGDVKAELEMLVLPLGSLSEHYETITKINVSFPGIDLIGALEMLRLESDIMQDEK